MPKLFNGSDKRMTGTIQSSRNEHEHSPAARQGAFSSATADRVLLTLETGPIMKSESSRKEKDRTQGPSKERRYGHET